MKRIINNRKYDTDTARLIHRAHNGFCRSDFRCMTECLYIKKTGEYFLHGEGHGMTKYAEHSGGTSSYGHAIIPYTFDDAKKWAQENMCVDDYEAHFGAVAE